MSQTSNRLVYKPHKKQIAVHRAVLIEGYKRVLLFWGRQVGKSMFSLQQLMLGAILDQGPYHNIFRTHKHAKEVIWKQYLHMIPKEFIYKTNATELEITLNYVSGPVTMPDGTVRIVEHDTSQPRSTIRLLGSDYADDDRGLKSKGMVFDEYQDQSPENWDTVYKYFMTTTKGWAIFMGTAKGYNHWYHMIQRVKSNPRWFYSEATWRDNPAVDEKWIRAERDEAEAEGKLGIFMQEVELQFRTPQGSVYPEFDREIHVVPPDKAPKSGTHYVTIDFGWVEGHPLAVNFITIDDKGVRWCWDEIHGFGIEIDEMIEIIKRKMGDKRLTLCVADSARPDLIALVKKQLPVVAVTKGQGSVASGIILLATKLKPREQLLGLPKPNYFFTSNCPETIFQMENYRYREVKAGATPNENPLKQHDDHPDGLRYLELWLKHGINTEKKYNISNIKLNNYGF